VNNKRMPKIFIGIVAGIAILAVIGFCARDYLIYYKNNPFYVSESYPTPEQAIEETLLSEDYKFVYQNDTGFGCCKTEVNNYSFQYLLRTEDGWRIITDNVISNPYFSVDRNKPDYDIIIRKYEGKYMIMVSQPFYSEEDYGMITVSDSLNTKYEQFEYSLLFKHNYWYWCLDELPDDYKIMINDVVEFDKGKLWYK